MYNNFSNYLGSRRCDNKCQGTIGPQGAQGKGGPIGPYGYTGPQGATGVRGATGCGCRGATGAQGVPGTNANQSIEFLVDPISYYTPTGSVDKFQQIYINATDTTSSTSITINIDSSSVVYIGTPYSSITLPSSGTSVQIVWNDSQSKWYVISDIGASFA
jgi:hypothetical protein